MSKVNSDVINQTTSIRKHKNYFRLFQGRLFIYFSVDWTLVSDILSRDIRAKMANHNEPPPLFGPDDDDMQDNVEDANDRSSDSQV